MEHEPGEVQDRVGKAAAEGKPLSFRTRNYLMETGVEEHVEAGEYLQTVLVKLISQKSLPMNRLLTDQVQDCLIAVTDRTVQA